MSDCLGKLNCQVVCSKYKECVEKHIEEDMRRQTQPIRLKMADFVVCEES